MDKNKQTIRKVKFVHQFATYVVQLEVFSIFIFDVCTQSSMKIFINADRLLTLLFDIQFSISLCLLISILFLRETKK